MKKVKIRSYCGFYQCFWKWGIDKAMSVLSYIRMGPDSLEAYYQEAGRTGRDEQKSYAVLLYNESDILESARRLEMSFRMFRLSEKLIRHWQIIFNCLLAQVKGVSLISISVHFVQLIICRLGSIQQSENTGTARTALLLRNLPICIRRFM